MSDNDKHEKLFTRPQELADQPTLTLTGNEYIALPWIDPAGGIRSLNVVRLDQNGLIEFCGDAEKPLLKPFLTIDGQNVSAETQAEWRYEADWLPSFQLTTADDLSFEGAIFAPPGHKGFIYNLKLVNKGKKTVELQCGWQGNWIATNYLIFSPRKIKGRQKISLNRWTDSLVLESRAGLPLAALALAVDSEGQWQIDKEDKRFSYKSEQRLAVGEELMLTLYGAVNLEGDGAATTTVDLRRRGFENLKQTTLDWLNNRRLPHRDKRLEKVQNRNLFFAYFYSLARSLDREELVALTSRSPRYYVSGAFWSRDSLLWSFPAILLAEPATARELLLTVYSRHLKNAGDHAHYLNGALLYPGFELDQLAAYFLALEHYLTLSGDYALLETATIRSGLSFLAEKALSQFDPQSGLYSTFLDPADDPVDYPFLTYDNALLQRSFRFLAVLQREEHWQHKSDFAVLAFELEQAIYDHCTVKGPCGEMFSWAVDGKGRFALYDNPPGSLQLLAHYRFCPFDNLIFKNTIQWIRSQHNRFFYKGENFEEAGSNHADKPWPLGASNDLLAFNCGAEDFLARAEMDNGFCCETVSPENGRVTTGAAFASAAGFLAYALQHRDQQER